jgi:hypothetical protein
MTCEITEAGFEFETGYQGVEHSVNPNLKINTVEMLVESRSKKAGLIGPATQSRARWAC